MIEQIIILIFLIALSALFSCSETALTVVSRFKVNYFLNQKKTGAYSLHEVRKHPHRMLSTLLICNNTVNITAAVIATNLSLQLFSSNVLALTTGVMTFVLLVFGEIVPKSLAASHSAPIALAVAPTVRSLGVVLYPLVLIFDFITQKIFRISRTAPKMTEEEVRNILDMANEEGAIDKDERELIRRIFKFDDINASEIMVPRLDMVAITKEGTLKDALRIIKKNRHSRVPVYESSHDTIVGIFYFKDALEHIERKRYDVPIERIMRPPFIIPESKKIDELLKDMQKNKQQMAIVVDEHGGVAGLVTMEDIIEELIGDIMDENERVIPAIRRIDSKTFKVLGKAEISEFKRKTRMRIRQEDDYGTFSGFILNKLGRIPIEGEEIDLGGAKATIAKVEGNRILEVIVKKK